MISASILLATLATTTLAINQEKTINSAEKRLSAFLASRAPAFDNNGDGSGEAFKGPIAVRIDDDERNPYTGDVPCGTDAVKSFHWSLFGRLIQDERQMQERTANSNNATIPKCGHTICDDPYVRDQTNTDAVKLRIVWTVWNDQIDRTQLDAVIDEYRRRMLSVNVHVVTHGVRFVTDTRYGTCLPPFSDTSDQWYIDLMNLKGAHAYEVGRAMNVFVGCQQPGKNGKLLGIATFPYDPIALTKYGGLWLNSDVMFPDDVTLLHESGHCFGLPHAFAGVEEVEHCNDHDGVCGKCCEHPHPRVDDAKDRSNLVGDFCSDTAAQPRRWECDSAPGEACNDQKWDEYGPTDYQNPMSYAMINATTGKPENCQTDFSEQQKRRIHCHLRSLLSGWLED
jgi:hypothetical protein